MRYLVTGGAGFIGSHLAERLLGDGHEVIVVDNLLTGRRENLAHLMDRLELIEGSVADAALMKRAMRGVDVVFHQAALPSVPRSLADPVATHQACATGTLVTLLAARDARVRRFVYASSSSAYGNTAQLPKHEDILPSPRSPYAVAKLAGEHYCAAFRASFEFEAIALRYFNVFGPRQDVTSQYGAVIPKMIDAALAKRSPVIFGDGEQTRDFTYIDNVVEANLLISRVSPLPPESVVNVGCGDRVSLNQLWEMVQEVTGVAIAPTYEPSRAGDVRDSLASLERAQRVLAYRPKVSLREGLRRCVEHFRLERDAERRHTVLR